MTDIPLPELRNDASAVTGYPPEPWELRGQMHLTAWRVPLSRLPRLSVGLRPVRAGGAALVATAWVIYEPGGVLSYRELLVAVCRAPGRPTAVDDHRHLGGQRPLAARWP